MNFPAGFLDDEAHTYYEWAAGNLGNVLCAGPHIFSDSVFVLHVSVSVSSNYQQQ